MPVLYCAFSSGRHICGILFVNVPFLRVQYVRLEVILLLQCQSSPIQQSNAKYLFGIDNMLLDFINICCVQVMVIVCWEWVGGSTVMLVSWHVLLYPFLTIVDSFLYILAWADCPCCYTIVHFHWLDLGSKVNIWVPF